MSEPTICNAFPVFETHEPLEWSPLWDAMRTAWHARKGEWVRTTENMYDEMLGAVPPAVMVPGGFALGEAAFESASGEPVYSCFWIRDGQHYARYMRLDAFRSLCRHGFRIGDRVTFTNEQGVKFPGHHVTGFREPLDNVMPDRLIFIDTSCHWLAKRAAELVCE